MYIKCFVAALVMAATPMSAALASNTIHSATTTEQIQVAQFLDYNNNGILLMSLERFRELNPQFSDAEMDDTIPEGTELFFQV